MCQCFNENRENGKMQNTSRRVLDFDNLSRIYIEIITNKTFSSFASL